MKKLTVTPNIKDPDEFYSELLAAHKGLSEAESHALNAQLVLIFANHIGNRAVLRDALDLARQGFGNKA